MEHYWAYRIVFFGCIALSIGVVMITVSSRQRGPARADTSQARPPLVARPPDTHDSARRHNAPKDIAGRSLLGSSEGTTALMSRVRITAVLPFRRQIHLYNFGDAAQDLSGWSLMTPHPGNGDSYTIPLGVVLLPGESLVVSVEEGTDVPGELHWRATGEQRVLELTGDTVILMDDMGKELSRFSYVRR